MACDYGYGELENKLIELFHSGAPDFDAAEELIRQGADVNAIGNDDYSNILSDILNGYWLYQSKNEPDDDICANCDDNYCDACKHNPNQNLGPSICAIIRFFLEHGFDVTKCDGCFGAQCLFELVLSTFDRYMIEATKLASLEAIANTLHSP